MVILLLIFNMYIEKQLKYICEQSIKPKHIMIIQMGNYMDINYLKETYNFIHIKQESEIPFHRFYQALCYNVDYYFFIKDYHLPNKLCFQYYIEQCEKFNSIIGFNGIIYNIKKKIFSNENMKVDFVRDFLCIKKEHLRNIFSVNIKECHMNTLHEFIYLCYINKLKNIDSRIIKESNSSFCRNRISNFILSSRKKEQYINFVHLQKEPKTLDEVTELIHEYFINEYDFKFIDNII